VGSDEGVTYDQLMAVAAAPGTLDRSLFDDRTLVALDYAEAMTVDDVSDELFSRVETVFATDEIVELTGVIAWENSSARFNRALRVPSQNLWNPGNKT
jgi:alkylhydroperoxidase family enzyme